MCTFLPVHLAAFVPTYLVTYLLPYLSTELKTFVGWYTLCSNSISLQYQPPTQSISSCPCTNQTIDSHMGEQLPDHLHIILVLNYNQYN